MRMRKALGSVVFFIVVLALVFVMVYSGLQILESTVFRSGEEAVESVTSKTIVRDGVEYFPRQDITVMMVLGIDQFGPVTSSNYHRNKGAADSIMLLIFDEKNEECTVLYLNRDTMLDMSVLGVRGEYAGTTYGQLALAHTYGSGLEDSCENVKDTLQKFLPGMTIDYYVAMNMDVLPILNDAVGGVTVTVVDDFSAVDPSITMGELTLHGDQVINFVRTRKDVGDQRNITRMQRQREYVAGFLSALREKESEDINFIANVYDAVYEYIVTDCSADTETVTLFEICQTFFGTVHDLEKLHIFRRYIPLLKQRCLDPFRRRLPEFFTDQNQRYPVDFAGLHQRDRFKKFIHSAKSAGKNKHTNGVLEKVDFADEKVTEVQRPGLIRIRVLFVRQNNVQAYSFAAGIERAFVRGFHDSAAASGKYCPHRQRRL